MQEKKEGKLVLCLEGVSCEILNDTSRDIANHRFVNRNKFDFMQNLFLDTINLQRVSQTTLEVIGKQFLRHRNTFPIHSDFEYCVLENKYRCRYLNRQNLSDLEILSKYCPKCRLTGQVQPNFFGLSTWSDYCLICTSKCH